MDSKLNLNTAYHNLKWHKWTGIYSAAIIMMHNFFFIIFLPELQAGCNNLFLHCEETRNSWSASSQLWEKEIIEPNKITYINNLLSALY